MNVSLLGLQQSGLHNHQVHKLGIPPANGWTQEMFSTYLGVDGALTIKTKKYMAKAEGAEWSD